MQGANDLEFVRTKIAEFVSLRKGRSYTCFGLLVIIVFAAIFLALISYPLLFLESPALVGAIILSVKPSLAKSLLPQQYIGLTAIGIGFLKSLGLIGYMIFYIVDYFYKVQEAQAFFYDQDGNLKILTPVISTNAHFFPSFIINSQSAKGIGIVLAILIAVVLVLELLSLSIFLQLFKNTQQIIKIVKEVNLESRRVQIVPDVSNSEVVNPPQSQETLDSNNPPQIQSVPVLPSSLNQLLDENEQQDNPQINNT